MHSPPLTPDADPPLLDEHGNRPAPVVTHCPVCNIAFVVLPSMLDGPLRCPNCASRFRPAEGGPD